MLIIYAVIIIVLIFLLLYWSLKKPEQILYYYIFSEFSGADINSSLINLRVFLLIILFISFLINKKQFFSNHINVTVYKRIVLPFIFMGMIAFAVDILTLTKIENIYRLFEKYYLKVFIILLLVFFIGKYINTKEKLEKLLQFGILGAFFSSIFSILQSLDISFSIEFARLITSNPQDFDYWLNYHTGARYSGLHSTALEATLSYLFAAVLCLFFIDRHYLFKIFSSIIVISLYLTKTRTGIIGFIFAVMIFYYLRFSRNKGKVKNIIIPLVLIIFPLMILFNLIEGNFSDIFRLKYAFLDFESRLALFQLSIHTIISNPFGTGILNHREALDANIYSIELPFWNVASDNTAHNQFLTVGVYWGIPMIIAQLYFFINLVKKINLNRVYSVWNSKLEICLLGAIFAYLLHGTLHNMYPLADYIFAIIIGIIVASSNINLINSSNKINILA